MTNLIPVATPVQIIVGSMLGATEYVAEALQDILKQKGINSELHFQPNFAEIQKFGTWLICSSTHGAGDLPDNIQAFGEALNNAANSDELHNVSYLTVALGDSSYDTFCEAGKNLHQFMGNAKAKPLADVFCIDVLEHSIPEDAATQWLTELLQA